MTLPEFQNDQTHPETPEFRQKRPFFQTYFYFQILCWCDNFWMEFIFSNSNRQKKSYRDKNSKLVDKKINQHAAQSDSEFYNTATSVASAPVANLRRDKSKRAAQVNFLGFKIMWNPRDVQENRVFRIFEEFWDLFNIGQIYRYSKVSLWSVFWTPDGVEIEIVRKLLNLATFTVKINFISCGLKSHVTRLDPETTTLYDIVYIRIERRFIYTQIENQLLLWIDLCTPLVFHK